MALAPCLAMPGVDRRVTIADHHRADAAPGAAISLLAKGVISPSVPLRRGRPAGHELLTPTPGTTAGGETSANKCTHSYGTPVGEPAARATFRCIGGFTQV
jgi:hypothetical protein